MIRKRLEIVFFVFLQSTAIKKSMDVKDIINKIYPMPEYSVETLLSHLRRKVYSKGSRLIESGVVDRNVFFLVQGIVRAYIPQEDRDITFWFGAEGTTVVSLKSYVSNEPGYETVECMENSVVYLLERSVLENLYSKDALKAQEYIKLRKFTRRELEDFKIGYSLNWNELINFLLKQGFSKSDLLASGVAQSKEEGRLYDAMGERLVFPIFNSFGECIGFTARALEKTDFAKYKNTAETMVFQKGKVVFGMHLLKRLKQEKGLNNIIIVEGQIDVISMHRAGFKNTVACLGTAATSDHARELKKLCDEVVLCFDGDEAGVKATLRSIDIFRNAGFKVKIACLPSGQDPDEVLKQEDGRQQMEQIVQNAKPIMDYYIDLELEKFDLNKPEEKAEFVQNVLDRLKNFSQPEQEAYIFKIRDLTAVPVDSLRRSLGINIMPTFEKQQNPVLVNRINGNKRAETFILASILHKKDFVPNFINYKKLIDGRDEEIDLIASTQRVSTLFDKVDVENQPFWQDLIYFNFAEAKGNEKQYFDECVWALAEEKLKQQKDELMLEYKNSQDLNQRRSLLIRVQEVDKKIREKNLEDFYA